MENESLHTEIVKHLLALNIPTNEIASGLGLASDELRRCLQEERRIAEDYDASCNGWYGRAFLSLAEKSAKQEKDCGIIAALSECVRKRNILTELGHAILAMRDIGGKLIPIASTWHTRLFWQLFGHQEANYSVDDAAEELFRIHLCRTARGQTPALENEMETVKAMTADLADRISRWLALPWQPFAADRLEEAISDLSPRQRLVLLAYFGLNNLTGGDTPWLCARILKCALKRLRLDPRLAPYSSPSRRRVQKTQNAQYCAQPLTDALSHLRVNGSSFVFSPPSCIQLLMTDGRKVFLDSLLLPAQRLWLTPRAKKAIQTLESPFIGDVIQLSQEQFLDLRNTGRNSVRSIHNALAEYNLNLGMRFCTDHLKTYLAYRALYT